MPAGTYSCQLLGAERKNRAQPHNCYNSDIGTLIQHTIIFKNFSTQGTSLFDTPAKAENLGNITNAIQGGVITTKDFFNGAIDTSKLDSTWFSSHRSYRKFYLDKPSQVIIRTQTAGGIETHVPNNWLMQGNISMGVNTLEQLDPTKFYGLFNYEFRTLCYPLDTGWYTLISGTELSCADPSLWVSRFQIVAGPEVCPASQSYNRPYKALVVNNGVGLRYGNNQGTADAPIYTNTYNLPQICFRCEPDEHPESHPIVPCSNGGTLLFQRWNYIVFKLDVNAHVQFMQNGYPVSGNTCKLFRLDVRKDSTGMLDPFKQVAPCGLGANFCKLEPGTYTWVIFNYASNSMMYNIMVDSVTTPKFDFASQTSDIGLLSPNIEVASAWDRMSCMVGANLNDPAYSGYQSYGWITGSNTSINYPVGKNNAQPEMPRRNVWYSFALDRPGVVNIQLDLSQDQAGGIINQPVAVYKLKADGRLSVAQLIATGQLDTTILQGLTYIGNNSSNGYTDPYLSVVKPDCGYTRYLVVVDNHNRNYKDLTMRMRLKFTDKSVNNAGDSCKNPVAFTVNMGNQATRSAFINCHTLGEGFGENGSNMGCVPEGGNIKAPGSVPMYKPAAPQILPSASAQILLPGRCITACYMVHAKH